MCGEESPVFTVVCIMLQLAYTLPYYWSYSHKLCWQTDVKKKKNTFHKTKNRNSEGCAKLLPINAFSKHFGCNCCSSLIV